MVSAIGLAIDTICTFSQRSVLNGIESVKISSSNDELATRSHAGPDMSPWLTSARTDLAPAAIITSAALHSVPAVSAISSMIRCFSVATVLQSIHLAVTVF